MIQTVLWKGGETCLHATTALLLRTLVGRDFGRLTAHEVRTLSILAQLGIKKALARYARARSESTAVERECLGQGQQVATYIYTCAWFCNINFLSGDLRIVRRSNDARTGIASGGPLASIARRPSDQRHALFWPCDVVPLPEFASPAHLVAEKRARAGVRPEQSIWTGPSHDRPGKNGRGWRDADRLYKGERHYTCRRIYERIHDGAGRIILLAIVFLCSAAHHTIRHNS